MKHTLLIFLLFIITNSFSQTEMDLMHVPKVWEVDSWDGANWNLVSQVTYTFNSNCLATEALAKFKDIGGSEMLENASFLTIAYDANDLPVESINQLWDDNTSTWANHLKTEFTHTGTNLTGFINYDWRNNNWEPTNRDIITYNTSNLVTENIKQTWDETNAIWINTTKIEYTYNPDNTFNIETTYNWNTSSNSWVNHLRVTHGYPGNQSRSEEADSWNGSTWENHELRHYTYDSNDFLIETLETEWNGTTYENDSRVLRTNNDDGSPTEMISQSWLFGVWFNIARDRRSYPDCQTLSTEKITESEFKIYPNPAKNEVTIQSKMKGTASIIDLNGRLLTTINIENDANTLDTSIINSGIYLLIFQNENVKETKRLVIEK